MSDSNVPGSHVSYRELDPVVLTRDIPEFDLRRGDLGAIV
jgi:hypothetical protein